jgi:hypothetical protein
MPSFELATPDGILPLRMAFMKSSSDRFMKSSFESVDGSAPAAVTGEEDAGFVAVAAGAALAAELLGAVEVGAAGLETGDEGDVTPAAVGDVAVADALEAVAWKLEVVVVVVVVVVTFCDSAAVKALGGGAARGTAFQPRLGAVGACVLAACGGVPRQPPLGVVGACAVGAGGGALRQPPPVVVGACAVVAAGDAGGGVSADETADEMTLPSASTIPPPDAGVGALLGEAWVGVAAALPSVVVVVVVVVAVRGVGGDGSYDHLKAAAEGVPEKIDDAGLFDDASVEALVVAGLAAVVTVVGLAAVPGAACPVVVWLCGTSLSSESAVMPSLAAPTMFPLS